MSGQTTLKISPEQASEMPMVDLAFMILKATNSPLYYRDLMQEIAKIKGLSEDEIMQVIAQVYTEINIDGRFACVGNNMWGLKRWYPIDKSEDGLNTGDRPRIINDDDDDLDDEDYEDDQEEDYVDEDSDEDEDADYDSVDEDSDEVFDDEEAEEIDEDVVEDEDLDEETEEEEGDLEEDDADPDLDPEDEDDDK